MNALEQKRQAVRHEAEENIGFVKALALKLVPYPNTAEDIAQEVFVEFLTHAERWDLTRNVQALLSGITRNVARRHWRNKTRKMSLELQVLVEHVADLAADDEEEWYGEEEKKALARCLRKLPDHSRRLVEWRYYLSLDSTGIGKKIGMKATTVRRALFRIRAKLLQCLHRELAEDLAHE